ncbi:HAMP domain-containing sensor histidine kinase [Nonomuraea sp. NPDC050404]|uniref:sensor histidine kinase n=1 Tax=Nonomuraea sp. NPDC050404 TaxID=3155783 RepID=UPI0033E5BDF9
MTFRVRKRAMSLETKLVVSSIALLAVVSAVVATATTLLFNDFLTDQLDLQVRAAARRSVGAPKSPGAPPEAREVTFLLSPGQAMETFGARVRLGEVRRAAVLTGVDTVQEVPAPPAVAAVTGRPVTIGLGPMGDYRMAAARTRDGDALVVGLPLSGLRSTLTRLIVVEAAVTLAGVSLMAIACTLLVRRAVRPLGRLAATAARVSELPLATGDAVRLARVPEVDTDPRTEVGQVGGAFNHMLGHVETAFAVRHESESRLRRFIADASHELRTPLASIVGYAELTRRSGEPHGPQTAHALGRIGSEAGRMSTLVEDLLLLARLDAGRPLERVALDLSPIVVNAISDAYAAAPGHRWLVGLPDQPALVLGDADRLHQVVANLLANARTHTPPGTTVTATVLMDSERVSVRVADDGPGIAPELLPHVFGRFARGDGSRSRLAGGSGLGLAIVSAVAAAHEGVVDVASVPGNTVFTLSLPASREQIPSVEGGAADGHEGGGGQGEPGRGREAG